MALVVVSVVATLALAVAATAIITRRSNTGGPAAPAVPTTTVTATPGTTSLSPGTRTPLSPTQTPTRTHSAADALAAFFAAAGALDRQLSTAASAINAAGPPWAAVTPRIAHLVSAADLRPVARTIPAGLPADLRTAVILTYSDLASRRDSMGSFAFAGSTEPRTSAELLRELGNGHPAAARFARDLAAARSLASESPEIGAVPKSSRQTAEVLLLVQYVDGLNGGCESRGGAVLTELPPITWHHEEAEPHRDGTIGGVWFTAHLTSNGDWQTALSAC
ncbi:MULTISPECIES: hypothetical protein [Kribbella]|uniref:hypothetical protein n=1 Tax=Kribbella TaxID=182639 RepID=UPI002F4A75EC